MGLRRFLGVAPLPRRISAVLGLVMVAALRLPAVAQNAAQAGTQAGASPLRAEFRTAARSLIVDPIDPTRLVATKGAVRREAATAQDMGARDPSAALEHVHLVLQRPRERQAAFDAEVQALHQPGNPSYHQWLTPETIGAEFGPSAEDIAALTGFLVSEGFTVNRVGKSGLYIDFSGTVGQVEQTFYTEIHTLRLASGEQHFSAVREAQLPEALAPLVAGFLSLSDIRPRPSLVPAVPAVQEAGRTGAQASVLPANAAGGDNDVGAQDFYTIYNEKPLLTAGTNGSGITVALLEETDINTADVTHFRTTFAVSPATPSLTVEHGSASVTCTDPGVTSKDEEGEAVLDTEWAGAVAPSAALLFMSCASTDTTGGIFFSAEAVIDDNLATTMSLSYGDSELDDMGENAFLSNLWEQAAAQGQTVVVSAGDAGSANTDDQNQSIATHGLAANGLGSTAYNVAAGGTDFQDYYNEFEGDTAFERSHYWAGTNSTGDSSALSYVAETPWNDTCASSILSFYVEKNTDPNSLCTDTSNRSTYLATAGGGGGVSILQPRPSWQNGTVYGIPPTSTYNFRLLPDVSLMAANGFWGHALDYYQRDVSRNSLQRAGGTSFVAPQLAGVFALIAQKTGERLGQPDYVLYNMAGVEYGTASYTPGTTCNGSGTTSNTGTTSTVPASTCIFYDIFTGNISQACTTGTSNCYTSSGTVGILSTSTTSAQVAYPAGEGFDLATGIGSFNIANLVNNWQNATDGGIAYTPTVVVNATAASYTYGLPSAITYTATVSGPGSFPTGSVTFSGSGAISTMGNDALVESSGCSSGGTCTENAAQAYTPPGTLAGGSYTITGTYLTTNENYASGSGTTSLTVSKQTPTVTVSAVTIGVGTATANLSANISYTGSGVAPTGGLTFQVDSGTIVTASCTGSSSPLSCTYSGYNTSALTAGPHTITATSVTDANYASASGTNTLSVLPMPTIVFTIPNHHTQDRPFTVSASSNSTGAITYSVMSGPATILGSTVTLTGAAGTVVLLASQAATSSYAAGMQTASFLVIAGSVWFANSTGSLSSFDLTGAAITGSGGYTGGGVGTIAPALGLAFDASGNVWVASTNGVSEFSRQGVAITSSAITAGGVSNPVAIAVDGAGQVWVANANGTVSVLTNAGAAVSPASGYSGPSATPAGIAVDISGSVWVPSSTANTVTRILGVAAPAVPLATAATSGAGVRP